MTASATQFRKQNIGHFFPSGGQQLRKGFPARRIEFEQVKVAGPLAPDFRGGIAEGEFYRINARNRMLVFLYLKMRDAVVRAAKNRLPAFRIEFPAQAAGDPSEEFEGGQRSSGCVADDHMPDLCKAFARRGEIEYLGHGVAQIEESRPIEVARAGAPVSERGDFAQDPELRGRTGPIGAVDDQPVDPAPELRIRFGVQLALPPKIEGQVRVEVGKDDAGQAARGGSVELEGDLLRANLLFARFAQMAVRRDPGVHTGLVRFRIGLHEECAKGVVGRDFREQGRVGRDGVGRLAVDDEIDERGTNFARVGLLPQSAELPVDLTDFDREARGNGGRGGHPTSGAKPRRLARATRRPRAVPTIPRDKSRDAAPRRRPMPPGFRQ